MALNFECMAQHFTKKKLAAFNETLTGHYLGLRSPIRIYN